MLKKRQTLEWLKDEVRRRGGILGVSPDAPPEVEAMLEQVLHCPLCAELERQHSPRDASH